MVPQQTLFHNLLFAFAELKKRINVKKKQLEVEKAEVESKKKKNTEKNVMIVSSTDSLHRICQQFH